jgi:Flp pilus assembly protein TadG
MGVHSLLPSPRRRRVDTSREDGAAAVEFGLIAPILFLLLFGIISFGILFAQQLSLGNSARQGARMAAVGERSCQQVMDEARTAAATINLPSAKVDVQVLRGTSLSVATVLPTCNSTTYPCTGSLSGENVYVKAWTDDAKFLIPLFKTGPFTIGSTGSFRCEYSS